MITFAVETLTAALPEMKTLFPRHWEELALDQQTVPLDPQYEVYLEREAKGEFLLVVGRESGAMAAYFCGFIAPGLHYRTCLTLTMDIFWVRPEARGGSAGLRLLRTVEVEARRRGIQRMFLGSKLHKDAGILFERLGFRPVETYYSKLLTSQE